jgi:hypothetical protein
MAARASGELKNTRGIAPLQMRMEATALYCRLTLLDNNRRAFRFKVLGSVVDKKVLLRIGGTIVGAMATVGPVIIGLRPDINEEFVHSSAAADESCILSKTERSVIQLAHSLLANKSCSYANVTIGSVFQ